ncbi:MAG: hypothetical protein Q7O66_11085 [Dehalococcoidia bacterium]|nr:hypothetical protein [Dehalococcoidia bacterium]
MKTYKEILKGNIDMWDKNELERIRQARNEWEDGTIRQSLYRFGIVESPNKVFTPLDVVNHDFLEKVGVPGQPPYTRGLYAMPVPDEASQGDPDRQASPDQEGT